MSQPATSSRLTNSAVNIIGATTAVNTNFGLNKIGVTGNSFDISSSSGTVTLGITGTGNVQIGNGTSGTVTFPGATTFTQPVNGGVFTGTAINGTAATTAFTIGSNLTTGSVTIGAQSANTVTIGANSIGATGTVNVGTGSANINIGSTAASAIVLGRTGGSVTLGPPLTLGAAPTTSAHLGGSIDVSLTLTANATVNNASGRYNQGSFTFSTHGVWLVSFYIASLVTGSSPSAVLGLFTGTSPYTAVSSPFVTVTQGDPNFTCFASGSFVSVITASVTFTMYINVFSGSMFMNGSQCEVIFTRLA